MAFKLPWARGSALKQDAQSEVEAYQSLLANILMMGTLIFGFCVAGTFLSVNFTGDEPWDDAFTFKAFVQSGCWTAVSSLAATTIAFICSTRVTNVLMHNGAKAAYRTVRMTTCFVVLAEMLLYFSMFSFVASIAYYTQLYYQGPKICPETEGNSSFCGQAGEEMYQVAQTMCGPAQSSLVFRGATCTSFDHYTEEEGNDNPYWYGWEWDVSGYEWMEEMYEIVDTDPYTPGYEEGYEIFFSVINELADKSCGKEDAQAGVEGLCTNVTLSTAACAQARSAFLLADACAGGKSDDAIKCRKVCKWMDGEPLKAAIQAELKFGIEAIMYGIAFVMAFRFLAGLVQVCKNFRDLSQESRSQMVFFFDVMGVCDMCHGQEDEDGTEDKDIANEEAKQESLA